MYHSDFFDYKRHSAVLDRLLFGTELGLLDTNQQKGSTDSIQTPDTIISGVDRLDPNTRYKQNRISGSIGSIQTHENIRGR